MADCGRKRHPAKSQRFSFYNAAGSGLPIHSLFKELDEKYLEGLVGVMTRLSEAERRLQSAGLKDVMY